MSSGSLKSNNKGIIRSSLALESEKKESYYGLSGALVSFSSLSNKDHTTDGYSTNRNIPFTELDPELKQILRQEFTDTPKNLKNV